MSASNSVYSPSIPYVTLIPGGLLPGKGIVFKGMVLAGKDKRFEINLCCGLLVDGDHKDNIALHFNPRFTENAVVLNSVVNNKWGSEERIPNVPFKQGQAFEIRILALTDIIKIAVNGKHFCDYKHRLTLQSVKTLYVKGCIQLDFIQFEGDPVPYTLPLPKGLGFKQQVFITGTPTQSAEGFAVNFLVKGDILFHFNPRFSAKEVVRNTMRKGKWETEEKNAPNFPFLQGGTFDLIILCDHDGFKVAVNGQHFCHYAHRVPPQVIESMSVQGDLTLQQIHLQ